jgi:hypothetical protein
MSSTIWLGATLYRECQSTSAKRVTPNSFAIASRGLVRVMRPHMNRKAYLDSNTSHSTARVTGSRLSTVNKNSAFFTFLHSHARKDDRT